VEIDPAAVDPAAFVKAVADTPEDQLAAGMADEQVRTLVLEGIFSQWAEHFDSQKAGDTDAVLEWRILDKPGGGYDRYQVAIANGHCTVEKDGEHAPRVTFTMKPVDFLKLVTGNAAGPMMFMTGKLKLEGDLMFAATVQSLFRIPGAS
jgi:putative sterol carrier protein